MVVDHLFTEKWKTVSKQKWIINSNSVNCVIQHKKCYIQFFWQLQLLFGKWFPPMWQKVECLHEIISFQLSTFNANMQIEIETASWKMFDEYLRSARIVFNFLLSFYLHGQTELSEITTVKSYRSNRLIYQLFNCVIFCKIKKAN